MALRDIFKKKPEPASPQTVPVSKPTPSVLYIPGVTPPPRSSVVPGLSTPLPPPPGKPQGVGGGGGGGSPVPKPAPAPMSSPNPLLNTPLPKPSTPKPAPAPMSSPTPLPPPPTRVQQDIKQDRPSRDISPGQRATLEKYERTGTKEFTSVDVINARDISRYSIVSEEAQIMTSNKLMRSEIPFSPVPTSSTTSDEDTSFFGRLKTSYSNINEDIKSKTTAPLSEFFSGKGITKERVADFVIGKEFVPNALEIVSPEFRQYKGVQRDVSKGVVVGTISDIQEKPLKNILLFGAGGVTGAGLKGAGLVLSGTKIGGKVIPFLEPVIGGLAIGATTYEVTKTGLEVSKSETPSEAGQLVGRKAVNFISLGAGIYAGSKTFDTGVDVFRTFGKKKIEGQDIIAPEYFEGTAQRNRYPAIKPGQTAGQLRQEFFEPVESLGEEFPSARGFTALGREPNPEEIVKGGSYVYGQFTAPRLSPTFLRTGAEGEGELSFTSKGILGFSRPTAVRFELEEVGFAPGVTAKTKNTVPVTRNMLEFFGGGVKEKGGGAVIDLGMPKAPQGSAFITFVKTEKEAVIPFGSKVVELSRGEFFKFGGRRIPIVRIKVLPDALSIRNARVSGLNVKSFSDFANDFSYSAESSAITPVNLIAFPSISKAKVKESYAPLESSSYNAYSVKDLSYSTPNYYSNKDYGYPPSYPKPSSPKSPKPSPPSSPISSKPKYPKSSQPYSFSYPDFTYLDYSPYKDPMVPLIPAIRIPDKPLGRVPTRRKFRRTPSLLAVSPEFGFFVSKPSKAEITGIIARGIVKGKRIKDEFNLI